MGLLPSYRVASRSHRKWRQGRRQPQSVRKQQGNGAADPKRAREWAGRSRRCSGGSSQGSPQRRRGAVTAAQLAHSGPASTAGPATRARFPADQQARTGIVGASAQSGSTCFSATPSARFGRSTRMTHSAKLRRLHRSSADRPDVTPGVRFCPKGPRQLSSWRPQALGPLSLSASR